MVSLSSPSGKLNPFYLARLAVSDTWAELLVLVNLTDPSSSRLAELLVWSGDLHPRSVARRDVWRVLAGATYATSSVPTLPLWSMPLFLERALYTPSNLSRLPLSARVNAHQRLVPKPANSAISGCKSRRVHYSLCHFSTMPPKQATLGYVKPAQMTLGCGSQLPNHSPHLYSTHSLS